MDNVTHGLFGLLVAEVGLVARYGGLRAVPPGLRGAALACSIAANNVPDLDFLYAGITEGKLGYLLHHRGHTHTLAAALPLAMLVGLPLLAFCLHKRPRWSKGDYGLLIALCLLGPVVHVGLDFLNNYGVHPFWPLNNRWFYGDAVFIVEPLFYLAMGLFLAPECRTRLGRWILWGLTAVVLAMCWLLPLVTAVWAALLSVVAILFWGIAAKTERRGRVLAAFSLCVGTALLFVGASQLARGQIARLLDAKAPGAVTHQLALTPFPGQPLCFSFHAVQTEGDAYIVRRGRAALAPRLWDIDACPALLEEGTTAPLVDVVLPEGPEVAWRGEFRAPLAKLRHLAAEHCEVAAFLRFARTPYFFRPEPENVIVGDLRYDRGRELDFADLTLDRHPEECPRAVPPWRPPLAHLLTKAEP